MATATEVLEGVQPHVDKTLVTRALEKLGSDRVMRGHVSLEHGKSDWHSCFLAMCFGGYGKLSGTLHEYSDPIFDVADMLGLTWHEVYAVTDAYDHCRAELQVLVEEWLELNRRNPMVALRDLFVREYGADKVDLRSFDKGVAYCEQLIDVAHPVIRDLNQLVETL